jgi:hypothetical protein
LGFKVFGKALNFVTNLLRHIVLLDEKENGFGNLLHTFQHQRNERARAQDTILVVDLFGQTNVLEVGSGS